MREDPNAPLLGTLRTCQEELARVRRSQEDLMEDLARERALRIEIDRQTSRLAAEVEQCLLPDISGTGLFGRIRRRTRRVRLGRAREWREVDLIMSSELFSASWYLRRYPKVVRSGLPPALHFVRYGARQGKDPSERFSTSRYLDSHPELRASGENPLVHYLRTEWLGARER